jgi:hypothetical protein
MHTNFLGQRLDNSLQAYGGSEKFNLTRIPLFTISRNALANQNALRVASQSPTPSVKPKYLYRIFIDRLLEQINSFPLLVRFLELIHEASDGDYYIFGGTLRRTLMSSEAECDLDIMVPNGDKRIFQLLDKHRVPYALNRRKHRRYSWNGLQFDINHPQEWCENFKDISDALRYFDLRINSLAYHVQTKTIIDPNGMVVSRSYCDPGINWKRWRSMPSLELAILAIRLHRILMECPQLQLNKTDIDILLKDVVPVVASVDWLGLYERFPRGRDVFLSDFEETVVSRVTQ